MDLTSRTLRDRDPRHKAASSSLTRWGSRRPSQPVWEGKPYLGKETGGPRAGPLACWVSLGFCLNLSVLLVTHLLNGETYIQLASQSGCEGKIRQDVNKIIPVKEGCSRR